MHPSRRSEDALKALIGSVLSSYFAFVLIQRAQIGSHLRTSENGTQILVELRGNRVNWLGLLM